jgi:hypothetical protein
LPGVGNTGHSAVVDIITEKGVIFVALRKTRNSFLTENFHGGGARFFKEQYFFYRLYHKKIIP